MKFAASIFPISKTTGQLALNQLNVDIYESTNLLKRIDGLGDKAYPRYFRKLHSYLRDLEQCKEQRLMWEHVTIADYSPYAPSKRDRENVINYPAVRYYSLTEAGNIAMAMHFWWLGRGRLKDLRRKQKILEDIVNVCVNLVCTGDDPFLEYELRRLEKELNPLPFDIGNIERIFPVFDDGLFVELKETVTQWIYERLRELRRWAIVLIKRSCSPFIPDLRLFFRKKIRFLFKNLDDCSDDHNALSYFQALSFINNNYSNETHKRTYSGTAGTP